LPFSKTNTHIVLLILSILSVLPIFFTNSLAAKYEFLNYTLIQLCVFWLLFTFKEDRFKFLLSPSFLAVSYLNLNFLLGFWAFKNDLVFTKLLPDYRLWSYGSTRIFFFNIINLVIILSYFIKLNLKFKSRKLIDFNKINQSFLFYATVLTFVIFLIISPLLNAFSSFTVVFKTVLALIIITCAHKRYALFKRILIYSSIIFVFVLFSTESKREAIFLILPILLLELSGIKLILKLKYIITSLLIMFSVFYLIITMSILRNYGGFNANNFFDATTYVDDYLKKETFVAGFMSNLEISTTYLHSNNVYEYLKRDKIDYVYGETIVKPLFIYLPRKYFKFKPRSAIDIYTSTYDKSFREIGGSFPISIQSELYLNFGVISYFIAFIMFAFFNSIYKNVLGLIKSNEILNYIYLLYMYEIFLSLIRGSGLDIFVVYSIIFILFLIVYKIFLKVTYVFAKA